MPHDPAALPQEAASAVLARLVETGTGDRLSLHDVIDALDDRAYGLLILVLAVPNIVPNPIPGLSGVMGVPLALICLQMALGWPHPWVPRWIGRRSVGRDTARRVLARALPRVQRLERLLKPRLPAFTSRPAERMVAVVCCVLAVLLALPIPFGNTPTAFALSLLALGLIERDGLCVALGLLAAVAGTALAVALGWGAIEAWQVAAAELLGR